MGSLAEAVVERKLVAVELVAALAAAAVDSTCLTN
jgi:hypothetical protein